MMDYTPDDWYWRVGDDQQAVWSSSRAIYVDATDPVYLTWVVSGGQTTPIGSERDLVDVLGRVGLRDSAPEIVPTTDDVYREKVRRHYAILGVTTEAGSLSVRTRIAEKSLALTYKRAIGETLSDEDQAYLTYAMAGQTRLQDLEAYAHTLMLSLPIDYRDDKHWTSETPIT